MTKWPVAVLFARHDSIYRGLAAEVFDEARDARTYTGTLPVVAHPPCRAWGRLRHFARPAPDEKELAHFAVAEVRRCGGVLEHPGHSLLWRAAGLPRPRDAPDRFGGWTLPVVQHWWGYRAMKPTWLYIVGVDWRSVPPFQLRIDEPTHIVCHNNSRKSKHAPRRPAMHKRERESTPRPFAEWLCELASRVLESSRAA